MAPSASAPTRPRLAGRPAAEAATQGPALPGGGTLPSGAAACGAARTGAGRPADTGAGLSLQLPRATGEGEGRFEDSGGSARGGLTAPRGPSPPSAGPGLRRELPPSRAAASRVRLRPFTRRSTAAAPSDFP